MSTFGYWDCRGKGQFLRLLLAYAGEACDDVTYVIGEGATNKWHSRDKLALGLDFPNLPYYTDKDVRLTESRAILRHLGRKYALDGASTAERAEADMAECVARDLGDALRELCFSDDFDTRSKAYVADVLPEKLRKISKFLEGRGNKWIIGEKLTFADFMLFEHLDWHVVVFQNCLEQFPNLAAYLERFRKLDRVKLFLESPAVVKNRERIFGPRAVRFGSH